jgi:nucleotide-binding universal stress UspA family protein
VRDPYEHIACCVDESDASKRALHEAQALRARLGPGRLSVVHTLASPVYFGVYYPPSDPVEPADVPEWLTALVRETPGAEAVVIDSYVGYPPAETVRWANGEGVELLVAASHRGLFQRMVLGSFAGHLAYHASCPVVLIPPVMAEAAPG